MSFPLPICFSMSAASSGVARGRMPGSVKLVWSREMTTNTKSTPPITGMPLVKFFTKNGQLGTRERERWWGFQKKNKSPEQFLILRSMFHFLELCYLADHWILWSVQWWMHLLPSLKPVRGVDEECSRQQPQFSWLQFTEQFYWLQDKSSFSCTYIKQLHNQSFKELRTEAISQLSTFTMKQSNHGSWIKVYISEYEQAWWHVWSVFFHQQKKSHVLLSLQMWGS